MSHPIVGFLQEQGHSYEEVCELLSPMEIYDENGDVSAIPPSGASAADFGTQRTPMEHYNSGNSMIAPTTQQDALRAVLTVARDERRPPGPQAVTPAPVAAAKTHDVKAIRIDTEESYKQARKGGRRGGKRRGGFRHHRDTAVVDALTEQSQRELMGEGLYERGQITDELLSGMYERDIMTSEEQSLGMYVRPQELEELAPSFGARGSAADIYGGSDSGFYIRPQERKELSVLGYTARQMEMLTPAQIELLGDVTALDPASQFYSDDPDEQIALSFARPTDGRHIASWQSGPNLYSSVRLTGWDGAPRILTATVPYSKATSAVVGYANRARVAPAHLIGMLHPLTQQLGASSLIPRICAASPGLLGAVRGKYGPLVVGVVSVRR